jgi:Holliday junction resolvase RusA-like endonuclease
MKLTLYGDPRTKKNSARILRTRAGAIFVAPSKAYVEYETDCLRQIKRPHSPISARVNVRCVYYMKTARRVDLANLIEATTDILVKAGVLADDNSKIVAAHDGSRVELDREKPRVEIEIEEMEDKNG